MKNNISDEALKLIMENASWERLGLSKPITESKPAPKGKAKVNESKEDSDDLSCPLCNHELSEAISDEALMTHVVQIMEAVEESGILTEAEVDEDDESLEDADEEGDDDEDEEDDEDSDDEDDEADEEDED